MPNPNLQCPHCGQLISAQVAPGQHIQCPNCQIAFTPAAPPRVIPPPLPGQMMGYAIPGGYGPQVGNGPATFGLICSFMFFILVAVIVAMAASRIVVANAISLSIACLALVSVILGLILGIVGAIKTRDPQVGGKGRAITAITLSSVALLFMLASIPFVIPAVIRGQEIRNRMCCSANLRQIGMAMMRYAHENKGRFPSRPEQLVLTQDIRPIVFICPSSNDTDAGGLTKPQQVANMSAAGHNSYIYLGQGKNDSVPANVVLVYEPITHHRSGFNALFADTHVEFITNPMAQKMYAELQAGLNPPPSYR
jgi:prepilin-type processing-associated H-X9-DG protein